MLVIITSIKKYGLIGFHPTTYRCAVMFSVYYTMHQLFTGLIGFIPLLTDVPGCYGIVAVHQTVKSNDSVVYFNNSI